MGSRTENVVFTTSFSAMFVVSLVHILHSWTSLWCPISLSAFCANMPLLKKQRHPKWFDFSCHLPTTHTYFFEELPFFKKNVQKQLLFESCKWNVVYSAPNLKIIFSKMCNFEGLIYVDQNSTFGQWQNCNIYNFKIGLSRFRWLYKVVLIGIFLKAKGNLSKVFLHLIFFACSMVW